LSLSPCHSCRFFGRNRGNFVPRPAWQGGAGGHRVCWVPAVGVGGGVTCKPWDALREHWDWHCSWVLVHAKTQVVLAVGLAPGCCASKSGDAVLPTGGDGGTKQAPWQFAACALQVIMQLVVLEDCARAGLASPAATSPSHTAIARILRLSRDRSPTL
jgi:hypothetical protein